MATKLNKALQTLADNVFPNVLIRSGENVSPAMAVVGGATGIELAMTRDNWPAAGVTIRLEASFDGGATWVIKNGPLLIDPFVPTPKEPNPTPASIGWGWGDSQNVPTHLRAGVVSPSNFRTDITLTVDG